MTDDNNAYDPDLQAALDKSRDKGTGGAGVTSKATLALVAAVLLAGGFFAGYVIKGDGASATASSGRQMGAGGFPGGNAEGGAPGAPSGAGAAGGGITAGTVSSVDGDTVTIKTADGKSVKVKTGTSTTVTLNTEGSVSDLASGDSVVVRGETADGTLKAESITEGSFGGFGGRPSDATTN